MKILFTVMTLIFTSSFAQAASSLPLYCYSLSNGVYTPPSGTPLKFSIESTGADEATLTFNGKAAPITANIREGSASGEVNQNETNTPQLYITPDNIPGTVYVLDYRNGGEFWEADSLSTGDGTFHEVKCFSKKAE